MRSFCRSRWNNIVILICGYFIDLPAYFIDFASCASVLKILWATLVVQVFTVIFITKNCCVHLNFF